MLRDLCFTAMLSARDQRRRELVKVLEELHYAYGVQLHITGDIPDDASKRACIQIVEARLKTKGD